MDCTTLVILTWWLAQTMQNDGWGVSIPVGSGAAASGNHVPANAVVARGQNHARDALARDLLLRYRGSATQ